jgi:hypothetical protein
MYTIGMIFRAIFGSDMPTSFINTAPVRPIQAIGLLSKRTERENADQNELAHLFSKLPSDLADPTNGMPIDDQGPFWIGFYHWVSATEYAKKYGPDELAAVGKILYGEQWQTNIARDLNLSDARRIRQWMTGDRKIPAGVWSDIAGLLQHKQLITGMMLDKLLERDK